MMYGDKLAVAVKVGGKVLRENGSRVALPFGSEYALMFKNLNSTRCVVNVEIDGKDVLGGNQIVVEPGATVDLERFLENKDSGRKFKFIQRTQAIENHRGIGVADGLILIKYQFEALASVLYNNSQYWTKGIISGSLMGGDNFGGASTTNTSYSSNSSGESQYINQVVGSAQASAVASQTMTTTSTHQAASYEPGITVKGSESNQKFTSTYVGPLEAKSHTLVIEMSGMVNETIAVKAPVTVKSIKTCPSCGRSHSSKLIYCAFDGTFLES